ncbi:MAG: MerR family transcriptional regulator [Candidatus Rokuibacteriota bacterium]
MAAQIPDKLFFRIGEVADLTGVPPYVLRYWESEFKLLRPRKNHAGQRVYRKPDIELVLRIKRLLYEDRLTLEGAKKRLLHESRTRVQQLELPVPDAQTMAVLRALRARLEGMRRLLRGQAEVSLERGRGAT